jgi:muramidase (phage lysozyme)
LDSFISDYQILTWVWLALTPQVLLKRIHPNYQNKKSQ